MKVSSIVEICSLKKHILLPVPYNFTWIRLVCACKNVMKTSPLLSPQCYKLQLVFPYAVHYLSWRGLICLAALRRACYTLFPVAHLAPSWPNLHATCRIWGHNGHAQWHTQCPLPNNCWASVWIHDLCVVGADAIPELPAEAPVPLPRAVLARWCGYRCWFSQYVLLCMCS